MYGRSEIYAKQVRSLLSEYEPVFKRLAKGNSSKHDRFPSPENLLQLGELVVLYGSIEDVNKYNRLLTNATKAEFFDWDIFAKRQERTRIDETYIKGQLNLEKVLQETSLNVGAKITVLPQLQR